jgi:cellulose synthase (UDP-forming)
VTGTKVTATSPFNFIMPQVLFFAFLLLTSAVGAWKDVSHGSLSLALIWNITNTVILGAFVLTAAREGRRTKRAAVAGRRVVDRPRRSAATRQPAFAGAPGGAA